MTDDNTPSGYTAGSSTPDHNGHSRWWAHELRARARMTGLAPALRFVYQTLDSYANGAPECCASVATLAEDTGYHPRTLQRLLRELEQEGWITTYPGQGMRGSGGVTTLYRIADPVATQVLADDAAKGAAQCRPGTAPPEGMGVGKDQPITADQQSRAIGTGPSGGALPPRHSAAPTVANSASRPARPDPKPVKQVGEAVAMPGGKVKRRRARRAPEEVVVTPAPPAPLFGDGPAPRYQNATERRQAHHEATIAAATRAAREGIAKREAREAARLAARKARDAARRDA